MGICTYGCGWLYAVVCGCELLCVVVCGFVCSCVVLCGCVWLCVSGSVRERVCGCVF